MILKVKTSVWAGEIGDEAVIATPELEFEIYDSFVVNINGPLHLEVLANGHISLDISELVAEVVREIGKTG